MLRRALLLQPLEKVCTDLSILLYGITKTYTSKFLGYLESFYVEGLQ